MAVFGYGRASTAAQVGSPANQKQIISDYCRKNDLPFEDDYFIDPATSGKIPIGERPAGKELLARIKRGDHIVVARLDRLARSFTGFAKILETIEALGVTVHVVDIPGGRLDPNNHIGRLLISILASFADYERRLLSIRIQEGNASIRAEGGAFGPVAKYGFRFVKKWSQRLGKNIRILEPYAPEQRLIQKALELRVQGMTYEAIGQYLTYKCKLRTRNGGDWTPQAVWDIVRTGYKQLAERENKDSYEVLAPAFRGDDVSILEDALADAFDDEDEYTRDTPPPDDSDEEDLEAQEEEVAAE